MTCEKIGCNKVADHCVEYNNYPDEQYCHEHYIENENWLEIELYRDAMLLTLEVVRQQQANITEPRESLSLADANVTRWANAASYERDQCNNTRNNKDE